MKIFLMKSESILTLHRLVCKQTNAHACYCHVSKTDTKEERLLNKIIIFVFFVHKNYSRTFIKLQLNPWCHMDYLNDVLATFLSLKCVSSVAVYGSESSRIHQKYLNLCSEDEQRSYKFGTTWGWVIHDRTFILGWIISLMRYRPRHVSFNWNVSVSSGKGMGSSLAETREDGQHAHF